MVRMSRDDVDELGETRDRDAVRVAQERNEQAANDQRVGQVVRVLGQGRRPLEPADGPRRLALAMLGHVPDVPLVDTEPDAPSAGPRGTVGIHDRRDAFDHPVQVRRAGEVVVHGLVGGRIVVGVQGDVIDRVAGELEHRRLPRAERRHRGPRASARHEFDRRVDEAHGDGGLRRATPILGGTGVTDLPRAVHLVAQTPGPDPVRLGMAISRPPVGDRAADR